MNLRLSIRFPLDAPTRPLTLLAEGLLKNRLVKAAEGGTEIFKFREQELLIPVWHVVLGLRGLLEAHRLGHGLWVTGHLWRNKESLRLTKANSNTECKMGLCLTFNLRKYICATDYRDY